MRSSSALSSSLACVKPQVPGLLVHDAVGHVSPQLLVLPFCSSLQYQSSALRRTGFEFLLTFQIVDSFFREQPDVLCRAITTSCFFLSVWFQTRDLRLVSGLELMLLTISNAECFGGSFRPVCSCRKGVLPGALLQLLHDETVLELFSVIKVVVLI